MFVVSSYSGFWCVLAGCGTAWSVQAQEAQAQASAPQEEVEEVVVTGFRASLSAALDDKRASAAAIDSIHAEDIAKFPDTNLAECDAAHLRRGHHRDAGEGRNISVRGLGPHFTRVRINGIERRAPPAAPTARAATTAPAASTSTSSRRSCSTASRCARARRPTSTRARSAPPSTSHRAPVRFPTASMVALRPRARYNDLAEKFDPRASVPHLQHLRRRPLRRAVLGRLHRAPSARGRHQHGALGQRHAASAASTPRRRPPGVTLAQANATTHFHPRLPRYGRLTHEQDRLGLTVALQWQANDAQPDHLRPALFAPQGQAPGGLPRGDLVQPHRRAGRQAADADRRRRLSTPTARCSTASSTAWTSAPSSASTSWTRSSRSPRSPRARAQRPLDAPRAGRPVAVGVPQSGADDDHVRSRRT